MASYSHIFQGFSLGFRFHSQLRYLLDSTPPSLCIAELDPETLRLSGIAALALDFDGVLASHGDLAPLPEAIDWLKRAEAVFGGDKMFILSNKPTDERRRWFAENFPAIRFIAGVRKKPYPDGLIKAAECAEVPLSSILMIDDRLLTGCLAALVAGARPCYIRNPFVSHRHRPLTELFFQCVRIAERTLIFLSAQSPPRQDF
jgi:HAD superfamily phosphatase (TIGR01668 family)